MFAVKMTCHGKKYTHNLMHVKHEDYVKNMSCSLTGQGPKRLERAESETEIVPESSNLLKQF